MRRNLEYGGRQDQTVRRDDQHLRPRGSEANEHGFVIQVLRLIDLQSADGGELLDGACRGTQAAAGGTVRLCQHQRDLVAGLEQRRQRARRKLWSTGEC